jgi:hypothetical protein
LQQFMAWVDNLDWFIVIIACLTLGLAPFTPPHILEKLQMLAKGRLIKPLDWVDLVFHGLPWVLLIIKAGITLKR